MVHELQASFSPQQEMRTWPWSFFAPGGAKYANESYAYEILVSIRNPARSWNLRTSKLT